MSAHLVPCLSCGRHVRVSETHCPFCLVGVPDAVRGAARPRVPPAGIARSALVAFGLVAAAGAGAACGDDDDVGSMGEVYGGPPMVDPAPPVVAPPPLPPPPAPPPVIMTPVPPPALPPAPPQADPPPQPTKRRTLRQPPQQPAPDPGNPVQAYGSPAMPPDDL